MNAIDGGFTGVVGQILAYLHAAYDFMLPHHAAHKTLWAVALNNAANIGRGYVWFILFGLVVYYLSVRKRGEGLSLKEALKFLLPESIYTHASFKIDLMVWPFQILLGFFVLSALTLGAATVQGWLVQTLGHSPLNIPESGFAVALQVVVLLQAADFARFVWHYQGHKIPFFWALHHGHHSAEVLHPFLVRTHPLDMIIRNTYMAIGGATIGGGLIYLLGMTLSPSAATFVTAFGSASLLLQHFEHSHVRVSFGKTLDRIFYAPHMHMIHHSAIPHHQDKNLGITGGLIFWDWAFGTLYMPKPGEKVVFGSTMQELGENNPHRTLKGFFFGPVKAAWAILRGRTGASGASTAAAPAPSLEVARSDRAGASETALLWW